MAKPEIHQTAVVGDQVSLGNDTCIGPYCVIDDGVTIGRGTVLHPHVAVTGAKTEIGEDCELFPFVSIGQRTQDLKYSGGEGRVTIEARTTLREYVTVHQPTDPAGETRVGSDCTLLAYSHVAHECTLGTGVIMSNATHLGGHVEVEDEVVFGGMCGIHQFVRIGRLAMIGATAKVTQDIVPYTLVDGNPATTRTINKVGLQRHGFSNERIQALNEAYRILFREGKVLKDALEQLRADYSEIPEITHMADFAEGSNRGLARPKKETDEETEN